MHLGICSFLERPVDGAVHEAGALPLHLTLLGNFKVQVDYDAIVLTVRAAARMLPIKVHLRGDERFGPNGEYLVTVAEPSDRLSELHNELLTRSREIEAAIDSPEFVGDGFRAHATWPGGKKPVFARGLTLETLSIVDLEPDGNGQLRRIADTF